MDNKDLLQLQENRFNIERDTFREDNLFCLIALNLSGKRNEIEYAAFKLIEKNGIYKALKLSRKKLDRKI